jgi:hypothetical protein
VVGETLTCFSSIAGGNTVTYQWSRDGDPLGPPSVDQSYIAQAADVSHVLTCTLTSTNRNGSASATSAGVIVAAAPAATPTPFTARVKSRAVKVAYLLRRGLPVVLNCSEACKIRVTLTIGPLHAKLLGLPASHTPAPRFVTIGQREVVLSTAGARSVHVALDVKVRHRLSRRRPGRLVVTVRAHDSHGRPVSGGRTLTIVR